MSGSPGRGTMTRAGTGYAGPRRRWSRKAATAAILVVAALTMAACSSGTDSNLQTAPVEAEIADDFEHREPEAPCRYGEHPASRTERLARR